MGWPSWATRPAAHKCPHRHADQFLASKRSGIADRMQRRFLECAALFHVDEDNIGVRAYTQHAFLRIQAEAFRRHHASHADVVAERKASSGYFGQHERHRRFDTGEAWCAIPDHIPVFLSVQVGGMVRR